MRIHTERVDRSWVWIIIRLCVGAGLMALSVWNLILLGVGDGDLLVMFICAAVGMPLYAEAFSRLV